MALQGCPEVGEKPENNGFFVIAGTVAKQRLKFEPYCPSRECRQDDLSWVSGIRGDLLSSS
jgi:hypothetical protein